MTGTSARPSAWRGAWERFAAFVHAIHGTRSLALAVTLLLVLSLTEPLFPQGLGRIVYTLPVFVLAVVGLLTLPREAVAMQARVQRMVVQPGAAPALARHLAFPVVLLLLLAPSIFLAAYGIPHLSPLTGLVTPEIQQRVAVAFLFLLLLLPVLQLRFSRRYAPEIKTRRPKDLPPLAFEHRQRDLLQVLQFILIVVWLLVLVPFWSPFSLFQWPPGFGSFSYGVRGVATLAYSVFLPSMLFMHAATHAQALRHLVRETDWRQELVDVALLVLHILGSIGAILLHAYDLLWIARYQSAVGF